jgi:SUMO ligase MMS21 Smc5/6 complex component
MKEKNKFNIKKILDLSLFFILKSEKKKFFEEIDFNINKISIILNKKIDKKVPITINPNQKIFISNKIKKYKLKKDKILKKKDIISNSKFFKGEYFKIYKIFPKSEN